MALPQTSFSEFFNQITGQAPVQNAGEKSYDLSGDTAPLPTATQAAPAAQPSPAPSTSPAPPPSAQPFSAGGPPSTGNVYDFGNLFAPVTSSVGKQQQALGTAKGKFTTEAGPSRSFESIGGQSTLASALNPTGNVETDKSRIEAGKNLVNARYSGPAGLDQATLDTITKAYQTLTPQASSLRTAEGAGELVRARTHGLSAGEREFESGRLLKNAGYQAAARNVAQDVGNTYADFLRSQKEAADFAKAREEQEADIAAKSKGFLTGQRGQTEQAIADRMKANQEKEDALQAAYDKYNETGDLTDLKALLSPEDYAKFDTDYGRLAKEAATTEAGILEKPEYARLKELKVPLMELTLNQHGREALQIPHSWWKENTAGMSKKDKAALKVLAQQRQLELEAAGFSPGSGAVKKQKARYEAAHQVGKYSSVAPLYFGDSFGNDFGTYEAPDTRSYVSEEMGNAVTRGSVASETERNVFNNVNAMLDEADRIEQEDPFQASVIRNEAQRYFDEQQAEKTAREEGLAKAVKKEAKIVKKARSSVRKARLGNAISKIVGSKTLGHTLAGVARGDTKAVANLPFAFATLPGTTSANPLNKEGEKSAQTMSLVKTPQKIKQKKVG